jgi:hypothetical protein
MTGKEKDRKNSFDSSLAGVVRVFRGKNISRRSLNGHGVASGTDNGGVEMPKNIVLLSDGTGNSAGKLFKTNVWRLYQALDLSGPNSATPNKEVGDKRNPVVIKRPKIHESVLERIKKGVDGYAPIVLPPQYAVVTANGDILDLGAPQRRAFPVRQRRGIAAPKGLAILLQQQHGNSHRDGYACC